MSLAEVMPQDTCIAAMRRNAQVVWRLSALAPTDCAVSREALSEHVLGKKVKAATAGNDRYGRTWRRCGT